MRLWTLSDDLLEEAPFGEFLLDAWNLWNRAEILLSNVFSEEGLRVLQQENARGRASASDAAEAPHLDPSTDAT